jgi:putative hemolysin
METADVLLQTRLARTEDDLLGAQRLRYRVFVEELGGNGPLVDHAGRYERDRFDTFFDHLILVDSSRPAQSHDHVVGTYRLLDGDGARRAGRFYSEDEYDLDPLRHGGRRLLELGRSCVASDLRGGTAVFQLWSALAAQVRARRIEVLFGVASLHGTDVAALAEPLSLLHERYLAPPALRVRSRAYQPMNLIPPERIDRRRAMVAVPALIKAYLRLGGHVGDGAFVDHAFNTTDVCLVMDTTTMNARSLALTAGRT